MIQVVYKGVTWLLDKGDQLLCLLEKVLDIVARVMKLTPTQVGEEVVGIIQKGSGLVLDLLATRGRRQRAAYRH